MSTFSMNDTANTTRMPARRPIRIEICGVTAEAPAVMPTRPASRPLPTMPTSGLPVLIQTVAMAPMAPAAAASVVVTAIGPMAESAASSEPGLKPYQPTSRMNTPSMAKGTLWPRMTLALPSGPYLPMRGPSTLAPQKAATPPVMCTRVEPAKS